jgi:hypothetical protein
MSDKIGTTLVIEKGGYRPDKSGPAVPPTSVENGYRPTESGPRQPPTQHPPVRQGGDTGRKK